MADVVLDERSEVSWKGCQDLEALDAHIDGTYLTITVNEIGVPFRPEPTSISKSF